MSDTLPQPPTRRFNEKRETILNAATVLFNRQGVKGATLADIAASVGLVTNSLTYYYRKKEDLAAACFLRTIEVLEETADQASLKPSLRERVHEFVRLRADQYAAIERGEHPALMYFHDVRALPAAQFAQITAAYNAMFGRVREMLRTPQTAYFARGDLSARAYLTVSASHWVAIWAETHELSDFPRLAFMLSEMLLEGLAAKDLPQPTEPFENELAWELHNASDAPSEAFLRAASLLVNEHGYRGASVDMISAHLNVTKGSFYHHNDHKEDLIAECFDRSFSVVRRTLHLAEQMPGTGWQRVCAFSRALSQFQLSGRGPLLRVGAMSAVFDSELGVKVRRTLDQLTERLALMIVGGMSDGSMRAMHPVLAAQLVNNMVNSSAGIVHWVGGVQESNVSDVYVRPLLMGMLCGPSRDRQPAVRVA